MFFTPVCHSVHWVGGGGVRLPSLHHRSHDQGGLHRGGSESGGGLHSGNVCLTSPVGLWGRGRGGVGHTSPPPRYMGYYGIQSTSGRYASYWNAFLLHVLNSYLLKLRNLFIKAAYILLDDVCQLLYFHWLVIE